MALNVFHTSDLHIGKKFAGYEDGSREALVEARFACLDRLVHEANRQKCDLLVIAGDLFERPDVPKKDVLRVAQSLAEFERTRPDRGCLAGSCARWGQAHER